MRKNRTFVKNFCKSSQKNFCKSSQNIKVTHRVSAAAVEDVSNQPAAAGFVCKPLVAASLLVKRHTLLEASRVLIAQPVLPRQRRTPAQPSHRTFVKVHKTTVIKLLQNLRYKICQKNATHLSVPLNKTVAMQGLACFTSGSPVTGDHMLAEFRTFVKVHKTTPVL